MFGGFSIVEIIVVVLWGLVGVINIANRIVNKKETVSFSAWLSSYVMLMISMVWLLKLI